MRTLFGVIVLGPLTIALCGCGAPEAEFSWSEATQDLMPAAQKAVKEFTTERFGTPENMVGWQRLPVAFGGVPGRVTKVHTETYENPDTDSEEELVVGFDVSFLTHAMLAKYDANLDDRLAFWELPDDIQKEVTLEKFEAADADQDGRLSATEVGEVRTRSELWIDETVSRLDEELAEELVGKEVVFVDGTLQYREGQEAPYQVEVKSVNPKTGYVEIWPPISHVPEDSEAPVKLVLRNIVFDFGRTMRSGRHLYMRHCVHCHGVTGDGNGPTAEYLSPLPRDFRNGKFKFVSVAAEPARGDGRASRSDLHRTLRQGIPGTYMPSFAMLKEEEVSDIVEYVRWLSMRGLYENKMATSVLVEYSNKTLNQQIQDKLTAYEAEYLAYENGNRDSEPEAVSEDSIRGEKQKELREFLKEELSEAVEEEVEFFLEPWHASEIYSNVVYPEVAKPPSTPASIARGRQLYLSKCAVCHGAMAEGNGENTRQYQKDPEGNEYPEPGFFDIWGNPIQPRNLTMGIYRGGRRPLDIYRRISQGIPGTPMQSFKAAFSDEQIWDLVDYVMSVPIDGAVPRSENENVVALQSASELPPEETGEAEPKPNEENVQPSKKQPAAEPNEPAKPSDENDE